MALDRAEGREARLSPPAEALAIFMSSVSEEAYCARWLVDLEFILWAELVDPGSGGFRGRLSDGERQGLKTLSEAAGGWVVYDKDKGNAFVTLDEWSRRFDAWSRSRGT